jgi:16S rRNA (guanine966-N2)-methyltransferase
MPRKTDSGSVRIIAGEWRSRRLPVIDIPGLRPSGDRSREILFNWLQAYIPGARCADLFAGTGALGLEAASRGASAVTLVESNKRVTTHLQVSIEMLEAAHVSLYHGDALTWLKSQAQQSLDIIFVDPPFADGIHEEVLKLIGQSGCLAEGGFVYLETAASQVLKSRPEGWSLWREKEIGDVHLQVFLNKGGSEPES